MNVLSTLLTSKVRSRLVRWLVEHRIATTSASAFARKHGFTPRAVVREAKVLERLGVLVRRRVGREDRLSANQTSGVLRALSMLVEEVDQLENERAHRDEKVRGALIAFGAPLARPLAEKGSSAVMPLEEAIVSALDVCKRDATLLRSLPIVLVNNRARLDLSALVELATRLKFSAELGMLLELTGELAGWPELSHRAAQLKDARRTKTRYFFRPRNRFEERAMREQTPEFAQRWGFWLNMDKEMFRSTMEGHARVR